MDSKELYITWSKYAKDNGIKTVNSDGRDPEDNDLMDFLDKLNLPPKIINSVINSFDFRDIEHNQKSKSTNKSDNRSNHGKENNSNEWSDDKLTALDDVKAMVDNLNKNTQKSLLRMLNVL